MRDGGQSKGSWVDDRDIFGRSFPIYKMVLALVILEPCVNAPGKTTLNHRGCRQHHLGPHGSPGGMVIEKLEELLERVGSVMDLDPVKVVVDILVEVSSLLGFLPPLSKHLFSCAPGLVGDLAGNGMGRELGEAAGDELGDGIAHGFVVHVVSMRVGVETGGHYLYSIAIEEAPDTTVKVPAVVATNNVSGVLPVPSDQLILPAMLTVLLPFEDCPL